MENQLIVLSHKFKPDNCNINLSAKMSINKPSSAIWSSTAIIDGGKITSDWLNWCLDEDFYLKSIKYAYLVTPKNNCNVYEINKDKELDFYKLNESYDGIHLSREFLSKFRYGYFYCWDVESTVWMNTDWIENIKEIEISDLVGF